MTKGISLLINFGPWGGFHAFNGEHFVKLTLGWAGFSIYWLDLDFVLDEWSDIRLAAKSGPVIVTAMRKAGE